jgi:hypothetical protein
MISTLKLPLKFDIEPTRSEVLAFDESQWTPHFNTQYYEGDWSGIALRAPENAHVALYPDPTVSTYVDTPALERCPSVSKILESFLCETEAVRFLRLGVGAAIKEHRDYKLGIEDGVARIHIPVKTSPDVEFFLDGQRVVMNEGEAWYLNFNLKHSVRNNGSTDRVHLVIDCIARNALF